MTITTLIESLMDYGIRKGMLEQEDRCFVRNQLYSILGIDGKSKVMPHVENSLNASEEMDGILSSILDWAFKKGLIPNRSADFSDLLDAKLMGTLLPRPSEVQRFFWSYHRQEPSRATTYLHHLGIHSNYIRTDRIRMNQSWVYPSLYGDLDISINLSKPEKDPKAIAATLQADRCVKQGDTNELVYPTCLLCRENEGFEGRLDHPARQNLRLIELNLSGESWYLQYSPYAYYPEHCIVLSKQHEPMKLTEKTFARLMDFVGLFPHYFIGSNADIPIVGGSILTHDHYQGGGYDFAMAKAPVEKKYRVGESWGIEVGRVHWPMSTLRISSSDLQKIITFAWHTYQKWLVYSDREANLLCGTEKEPHNTVTPIARKRGQQYELDLVLRNNRTTEEHPDGLFHPHKELHHIKKENIGLIEVMGLAVLPGRLDRELGKIAQALMNGEQRATLDCDEDLQKHGDWYEADLIQYAGKSDTVIKKALQQEVGKKFEQVLLDAGVFKRTEQGLQQFDRFIESL